MDSLIKENNFNSKDFNLNYYLKVIKSKDINKIRLNINRDIIFNLYQNEILNESHLKFFFENVIKCLSFPFIK